MSTLDTIDGDKTADPSASSVAQNTAQYGEAPPPYPGVPGGDTQGYPPYPAAGYPPNTAPYSGYPPPQTSDGFTYYNSDSNNPPGTVTMTAAQQPVRTVVVLRGGNCPSCNVGVIMENFTPAGICLAVIFFPIGLICCLGMRQLQCSHCGYRP